MPNTGAQTDGYFDKSPPIVLAFYSSKYKPKAKGELVRDKVEEVLNRLRPSLHADGGDVELIDIQDGIVSVKLTGACSGCPMSTLTLKNSIERLLKEEISDIKEVVGV